MVKGRRDSARPAGQAGRRGSSQNGSILILVLVVCLGLALLVHVMSTVTICVERAMADERSGRARMTEKEVALAALRARALGDWSPRDWEAVGTPGLPAEASLSAIEGSTWLMQASSRQDPMVSATVVSCWLERGRDGIDLPLAAIVAGSITATAGREAPWLEVDPAGCGAAAGEGESDPCTATACVGVLPSESLVGEGSSVVRRDGEWRLDPGWTQFVSSQTAEETGGSAPSGDDPLQGALACGPNVLMASGDSGRWLSLEDLLGAGGGSSAAGRTLESPLLVIMTGGAGLDASGLGDLYAVVVVDGGPVRIEGTVVHGAVFATEALDVGSIGRILFCRQVLRWAGDRSLCRVRLVPGTRREVTE
jgi:hypothetical protein